MTLRATKESIFYDIHNIYRPRADKRPKRSATPESTPMPVVGSTMLCCSMLMYTDRGKPEREKREEEREREREDARETKRERGKEKLGEGEREGAPKPSSPRPLGPLGRAPVSNET